MFRLKNNPVLTIYGRLEPKDDLCFIFKEKGVDFRKLFEKTKQKDTGLHEFYFANIIAGVTNLKRFPQTLKPFSKDRLVKFFLRLSEKMLKEIKPQSAFTLIELLIALAVLITTAAGSVVIWQERVSPTPTLSPTPILTLVLTPTPSLTRQDALTFCRTDDDCPAIPPCYGCPYYKCIKGRCQMVESKKYQTLSCFDNCRIELSPNETVNILNLNLFLTLLKITASKEGCLACPVTVELEVKSGPKTEKIIFQVPGFATKEWGTHRIKEIFGFKILLENVRPELIILRVQKI